ncbi:MarR family winged helix-turn-helix transcriptional regulator [Acidiluteibacter ferrifornacis]|uniref:MarR family transcriptional regulator n=1 Tax=Acidiluteibacter ferrifornacis TaxID=2692424 RepID=A0A6N9NFI7_9FLAO|nr:MarR family transcriptional regulator [Acidiluteibacter ferrifornacis]NBG65408.1 MarR family transcriptional regulator [Acidiluteibacter ferrifornacis]
MKIEDEIKQSKFESEFHKLTINVLFSGKWINDVMNQFHKQFDISSQQYNVLRILRGQYPKAATVNLISERMIDRMSNVSRLIDKLETKGLVERSSCKNDRRQVDIKITNDGLQLLKQIDVQQAQIMEKFNHLTTEEAIQLNNLLDKFRG